MPLDQSWNITAVPAANGVIDPIGVTQVADAGDQMYSITPHAGFFIANVIVDGLSIGGVSSYQFSNVTSDHTITAVFSPIYTVTVVPQGSGSVSPSTVNAVHAGSDLALTFTPAADHFVSALVVDGAHRPVAASLTLPAVAKDHTVLVAFGVVSGTTAYDHLHEGSLKELNVVGDGGLARYKPQQYSTPPPQPRPWRFGRKPSGPQSPDE